VINYFKRMLPDWHMASTTVVGLFGGLVALWDPRWVNVREFSCFVSILLDGYIRGLKGHIHILNVYAPYKDRVVFWDKLIASRILELVSLIITGHLNCTIGLEEVWGRSKKVDTMV